MKDKVLKHFHYEGQELSDEMIALIDEAIEEVKKYSNFKAIHIIDEFDEVQNDLVHYHLNLDMPQFKAYFKGAHHCILIACTLGLTLERRFHYLENVEPTKMLIMDGVASVYLEELCDQYQESLPYKIETYRFCPGYQGTPLSLNREIATILDIYKNLGIDLTKHDIMIPQKSMIGLIGIGSKAKVTCGNCVFLHDCIFRKKGQRCYDED